MAKKKDPLVFTLFEEFLPTQLSKSQRRRLEILEAAIDLYATQGIESVTYAHLAERSGASRALVQHYFPDHDELTLTAMKYIRARFQKLAVDEMMKHDEPLSQLDAYVGSTFDWVERCPRDARVWLLFYYYCSFRPEYLEINSSLVQQGHERICALLERGKKARAFKLKDVPAAAKLIQGVIRGGIYTVLTERRLASVPPSREATIALCRQIAGCSG